MSFATARRNAATPGHAARPAVEGLEPRVALSGTATVVGDQLIVVGSDGPDRILVHQARGRAPWA